MTYIKNIILNRSIIYGTQQLLGYKYIFRGFIVRNWNNSDDTSLKYTALNKIIVKDYIQHYVRMWFKRNERRHCKVTRRERLLK